MSKHNLKILWSQYHKAQALAFMQDAINQEDYVWAMFHQFEFLMYHDEMSLLINKGKSRLFLSQFICDAHGLSHFSLPNNIKENT